MELRHLRYFLAVAEELHFTRAAERLHIGQPPLSQQIQALEAELGFDLFVRNRRRVALTAAGEHFLASTRTLLRNLETAVEQAARVARGEAGELRIGFTASIPLTGLLTAVLNDFRQSVPAVTLTLREMGTLQQLQAVTNGELDVGLVRKADDVEPPGLRLQRLLDHPLRVVIRSDHPLAQRGSLTLAELRDEPFVMYPAASGTGLSRQLYRLCREAGFAPRVVQEAGEATTLIGLVAAGLGLTLMPAPLECVQIEGIRYLPLQDPSAFTTLLLATRQNDRSPLVARFVAMLNEERREQSGIPSGKTP